MSASFPRLGSTVPVGEAHIDIAKLYVKKSLLSIHEEREQERERAFTKSEPGRADRAE